MLKRAWFVDEIYTKNQDELHLIAMQEETRQLIFRGFKKTQEFLFE